MWSVKPHVVLRHVRVVIGMGGCVFCWVSSTSFSCVRILWGDTELCCNAAYRAHCKKIGFSPWRVPKVAVTFLLKLFCGNILHVPVSGWMSHLHVGNEQQELSGLPEALECSSVQSSPKPWAPCDGATGHLTSSYMALQSVCLLELQTFRARTISPKSSPRQFSSARFSVIYQEFL